MHISNNNQLVSNMLSIDSSTSVISISKRKLQQITTENYWIINEHNKNIPLKSNANIKEFIEVTRRIKESKLEFIDKQLSYVNNQDLTILQQIYRNPELILTTENSFFINKKFPFIILKSLQLGFISVFEFASLQTWHEVYLEQKLIKPDSNPQLYNLFNADNSYNETAWEIIISSIKSCNPSFNKDIIQLNNSQVIETLRLKAVNSLPIDRCFLLFKLASPIDKKGLYKILINSGIKFFSIYQDKIMATSIALYQNLLDAVFIDNICKINPVIGISSPKDIRDSAYAFKRDFAIPFPEHKFPQKVHGFLVKQILEFQYHDIYHVFHMCLMSADAIIFYLKIGDALLELRNKCDATINSLTQLSLQKLEQLEDFKKKLTKMKASNRIKAEKILFNEFYCIIKIIQLLENMRKAYGQFKFEMYDTDVNHFENREIKLINKYGKNGVYLLNIILLLARKNKRTPVLSGVMAEIAGKTVIEEANKMLDMHSSCEFFYNSFSNKHCNHHEKNILSFLSGGLKYFEEVAPSES